MWNIFVPVIMVNTRDLFGEFFFNGYKDPFWVSYDRYT